MNSTSRRWVKPMEGGSSAPAFLSLLPRKQSGSKAAALHIRPPLLLRENGFGHHAMHALADVDDLRDAAIADHRCERVSLLARHRHHLLVRKKIDRVS